MNRRVSLTALLLALTPILVCTPHALAQQGTSEFGVDLGFGYAIPDGSGDNVFGINVPTASFRWAQFASDAWAIETDIGFELTNVDGDTETLLGLGLNFQYHFLDDPKQARPFFAFGGGFQSFNPLTSSRTFNRWLAGAGFGVKIPVREFLGIRLSASYARGFETDDLVATNEIHFSLGMSFFVGPKKPATVRPAGPAPPRAPSPQVTPEPTVAPQPAVVPGPYDAPKPAVVPAGLPDYALGNWIGSIEPPIGSAYAVTVVFQQAQPIGLAVGTATYESPAETCEYTLTLDTVSMDGFSVIQDLDAGRCAGRNRISFSRESPGVLVGDWSYPDGRRWLTAPLRKQELGGRPQ